MTKRPPSITGKEAAPPPNPWEALFTSVTRPHPALPSLPLPDVVNDSTSSTSNASATVGRESTSIPLSTSSVGGYTILIQHSMTPKSQRQWALASTMAMTTDHARSKTQTSHLKSAPPSRRGAFQGDWYGISGPFLVRQSLEELSQKCDGAVVYVSVIGTSGVLDVDEMGEADGDDDLNNCLDGDDEEEGYGSDTYNFESRDKHRQQKELRKRRDAIKKFHKNGLCVDLSSDPFGWEDSNDSEEDCRNSSSVVKSNMSDLPSIVRAIRQAATAVEFRRSQLQLSELPKSKSSKAANEMQRPIPIIFETLTPLLHWHGVEKVDLLLKSLGRVVPPSSLTSSICKDDPSTEGAQTKMVRPPILSPIIAPILYESLRPSDHRWLEDMAHAILSLNVMDVQGTSNVISMMDIVRRGGRGAGMGGKLIRHCMPFRIAKSASNEWRTKDVRDGCYWILDYNESDEGGSDGEKNQKSKGTRQMKQESAGIVSSISEAPGSGLNGPSSRPRIYLEENDPQFDDFDEEDPDDDLDL